MRGVLIAVLTLHALIHLMGVAKGFALAAVPQLSTPISRGAAVLWLAAALLGLAAAACVVAWPRGWWMVGAVAIVVSQAAILTAWPDARAGTLVNVALGVFVAGAALMHGPGSVRARFKIEAAAVLAAPPPSRLVTDADLAPLPAPVRRYLRFAGVVGRPAVHSFRVRMRGRLRADPGARWMPFTADQVSTIAPPRRLFIMDATYLGVPVQAFHRLAGGHARMQVRAVGAVPIQDLAGDVLDRSEAVTFFNDLCLMAPAALIDPAITWTTLDDRRAGAAFTLGAQTIAATLHVDGEGRLCDFESEDRARTVPGSPAAERTHFTTPVTAYAGAGGAGRVARAEGRWHPAEGAFAYGEFEIVELVANPER